MFSFPVHENIIGNTLWKVCLFLKCLIWVSLVYLTYYWNSITGQPFSIFPLLCADSSLPTFWYELIRAVSVFIVFSQSRHVCPKLFWHLWHIGARKICVDLNLFLPYVYITNNIYYTRSVYKHVQQKCWPLFVEIRLLNKFGKR